MIHTLLFRLNNPGLYAAAKALKELRELIHCCLTDGIPGRHKINKIKTRLADIQQKARDKGCRSKHVQLIHDIQRLLELVETTFREIRDYNLEKDREIIHFFALYLSLLDTLGEAITGSLSKSGAAAARAGKLIAEGRKSLRSFRTDNLSRPDNLPGGMTLLTLYGHFETWLSETGKLAGNFCIIPKDGGLGSGNTPVLPVDKMDEDFNELIEEAAALKKDFNRCHYSWYRYSPRHPGYTFWKQNVLRFIKHSFGEQSLQYTNLVETEKNYSDSLPSSVFSAFMKTLEKARHAPRQVSPVVYGACAVPPPHVPAVPVAPLPAQQQPAEQIVKAAPPVETPAAPELPAAPLPQPKKESRKTKADPPLRPFGQLDPEAKEIYGRLLAAARRFIIQAGRPADGIYGEVTDLCDLTLETLKTNPVLLNYAAFATADNYLYAHTANVIILSQAIALDLALPQEDTRLLSFCAMAHDWGMTEFQELSSKKEYLTDAEFSQVALHAEAGAAKLDNMPDLDPLLKERIKKIVCQAHERVGANGYPFRLSGKEIDILAQIIGIADVYEAMTHPRNWREALHPHEVVKQFMEQKTGPEFGRKILKALIHAISIYPPASLVALSSGEIARVIRVRKGSLTRPLVEIILDADFAPVQDHILDLYEHPLHDAIARPVFQAELEKRNPEFAAGLESARWWVED
ncbi:hypothetical protein CO111_06295 [Candidatus Desantisbacteria bacterium CG_4_9_14_3_um_filter_50_7]|nr:MAG: hypothetical protein CO111_06295 [Candidatus Desantisbacteria bacterium CG_4_9_14_3_um_filter_50_7]